jgi:hypothetical protein
MRQAVFEYIEVNYNRTRRHSANGYISPEALKAKKPLRLQLTENHKLLSPLDILSIEHTN